MKSDRRFKIQVKTPKILHKKKEDIGLSPYAVVFRGEQRTEKTVMHVMDFDLDEVREYSISEANQMLSIRKSKNLSWINVNGIHDADFLKVLATQFEVPNNILSDILNPSIRSKVEIFEKGILITLKMIRYHEKSDDLIINNLSLILTDTTLLTFQEESAGVFEPVRERIRKYNNKIRTSGTDYLGFALLDVVVDHYIYIMGILAEKIENVDEKLTFHPGKELLEEINVYKREINILRKNILPAKEMIFSLLKMDDDLLSPDNRLHYRELQENIKEATELTDTYREILFDQMSIYHTIMSSKLNDIMRTLTIYSVLFIPLTFIVGVYGTNFDFLPEIHWQYGYYAMWGFMILLSCLMLIFFKRKKWF